MRPGSLGVAPVLVFIVLIFLAGQASAQTSGNASDEENYLLDTTVNVTATITHGTSGLANGISSYNATAANTSDGSGGNSGETLPPGGSDSPDLPVNASDLNASVMDGSGSEPPVIPDAAEETQVQVPPEEEVVPQETPTVEETPTVAAALVSTAAPASPEPSLPVPIPARNLLVIGGLILVISMIAITAYLVWLDRTGRLS